MASTPLVFISYSHRDRRWLDRLLVHLRPLERAGAIRAWADTTRAAGSDWRAEIAAAISAARVAVLLVSADFIASDFVTKGELPPLLDAVRGRGAVVIPVIVSPSRFEQIPELASLQSSNAPSRPLSALRKHEQERRLVELSIQIEGALVKAGGPSSHDVGAAIPGPPRLPVTPFPGVSHTTRSAAAGRRQVTRDPARADVSLFAERGTQWAVIIGATPRSLVGNSYPVEWFDASDVLDWFWSAELGGSLERVYFLAADHATSAEVSWALDDLAARVDPADSVLFYFAGHATQFSSPGELLLSDAFEGQEWGRVGPETPGVLRASDLIAWCNRLPAEKVVCLLDSGGPACHDAGDALGPGRYLLSSLNSRTGPRNGLLTWYMRKAVQRWGKGLSVAQLFALLRDAEALLGDEFYVYLRGADAAGTSPRSTARITRRSRA
jgi:hypothetical protein